MEIDGAAHIEMTEEQVGREYLELATEGVSFDGGNMDGNKQEGGNSNNYNEEEVVVVEEDDDDDEEEMQDVLKASGKINQDEFKNVLDRLDDEDLKERLKLAMSGDQSLNQQQPDPPLPPEHVKQEIESLVESKSNSSVNVSSSTDRLVKPEPVRSSSAIENDNNGSNGQLIKPQPRKQGKGNAIDVVKTLMGSHRRSKSTAVVARKTNIEVTDLDDGPASSFVAPFQVSNRNDQLAVYPPASAGSGARSYMPPPQSVYDRRPRQSPYGSVTPRDRRTYTFCSTPCSENLTLGKM